MNIVSQFARDLLKNRIKIEISSVSDSFVDHLLDSFSSYQDNKYIELSNSIQQTTRDIIKKVIISVFEELDLQYCNSLERKCRYRINKSRVKRTIITMFGEITFYRTYYVSKLNKSYHFYIDSLFDLPAYDHYDPIVKATVIDKTFSSNQTQAGKDVGEIISTISDVLSPVRDKFHIPRQSVHHWIKKWNAPNLTYDRQVTPDTLFVMCDEKYLGCQDLDKDIMTKCFILFEGIQKIGKHRNKLINRTVFSTYSSSPWEYVETIISQKYDLKKLKNIILLGDGGNWIKSGIHELKMESHIHVSYFLCEFHFIQAIHRITTDKELRISLIHTFKNKLKKDFIQEVNKTALLHPDRKEKIEKNLNYICSNYKSIKEMIKSPIGSSMESHISHCIANMFASRPKGYSSLLISKYLKINDYKNNHLNIMGLYLKTYKNKETVDLNSESINYSIFDKTSSNLELINSGSTNFTALTLRALAH